MTEADWPYDQDDEAFRAEWAPATARAAALVRKHLAERRGEPPPAATDRALAELSAAVDRGDPALTWLVGAAAMEPAELADADAEVLVDLVAASISVTDMVDDHRLPTGQAARVMAVDLPAWVGLVAQLVRAGPGAAADADDLAVLVGRVAGDELDDPDLDDLARAFEILLPAWQAVGVVDRDRRLTEAGAWLLPRAACSAWDSDFDDPDAYEPRYPVERGWVAYAEEEAPELDPDEAAEAAAALRHLASAGALDLPNLAGRVSDDVERDIAPGDLRELLFDLPDAFPLRDGRWVHLPTLTERIVAAHRVTDEEVALGALERDLTSPISAG